MPQYDFRCPGCKLQIDDIHVSSYRDVIRAPRPCPMCGVSMERVPTAANFSVKGFAAKNGYSNE